MLIYILSNTKLVQWLKDTTLLVNVLSKVCVTWCTSSANETGSDILAREIIHLATWVHPDTIFPIVIVGFPRKKRIKHHSIAIDIQEDALIDLVCETKPDGERFRTEMLSYHC